jgi:polysaccharide export outer membrane protein
MNIMKKIVWLGCIAIIFSSCGANLKKIQKDYLLFQTGLDSMAKPEYKALRIEARDNLEILVYTEAVTSSEQVTLFNNASEGRNGKVTVDENGFLEVPKLGKIKAAGLTCKQLADTLTERLKFFVKKPGVFVKLDGFKINIIGEVRNPGIKLFTDERATLIDALSQSGGFADDATRNDVLIIREDSGTRKSIVVNFQDANALYGSPAYQLKQNDLVFVRPSESKYRTIYNQSVQQKLQPVLNYATITSYALNFVLLAIALFKK